MPHILIVTQFMTCSVNRLSNDENKYWGEKKKILEVPSYPMYIYRGERWGKEKRHKVGWKESRKERGRLYVGKNLKNHWRAQRK